MDVRDFSAWSQEAARRVLQRRSEAYAAALLPHQMETDMRRTLDALSLQFYELDHADEIEDIDALAKRRLEDMKNKRGRGLE